METNSNIERVWHQLVAGVAILRGVISYQRSVMLILLLFAHKRLSETSQLPKSTHTTIFTDTWRSIDFFELRKTLEHISFDLNSVFTSAKVQFQFTSDFFNIESLTHSIPNDRQRELFNLFASMDLGESLSHGDLRQILQNFSGLLGSRTSQIVYKLAGRLLKPKPHELLLIPFLGTGNALLWLADTADNWNSPADRAEGLIETWEWNIEDYSISLIYALLLGMPLQSVNIGNYFQLHKTGSIQLDFFDIERHTDMLRQTPDLIFLNATTGHRPSINSRVEAHLHGKSFVIQKNRMNLFYISSALQTLKKDGRMIAVLRPTDLSTSDSLRKLWQSICDRDYIEAIIHLPRAPLTSSASVIVFFNKKKQPYKKHKILFSKITSRRDEEEEVGRLANLIETFQANPETDAVARLEDVQQNGYNLLPQYYFGGLAAEIQKVTASNIGKRIGDLCEVYRGKFRGVFVSSPNGTPYVSIKDLSNNVAEPFLDVTKASLCGNYAAQEIEKRKSILISLVGREIKPTIYDGTDTRGVLISPNIAILIPDENLVDFHYFYYQLHTPLVQKQFEAFLSVGTAQPSINVQTLQGIVVAAPDVEVQRSLASQQRSLILQAENQRHQAVIERLEGEDRKQEAEFSIVRHLTHNIKPKIQIVKSPINVLLHFLEGKGLLNEVLAKRLDSSDETVGEAINSALLSLNQISEVLDSCRKLVVKEIPKSEFSSTDLKSLFEYSILPAYRNESFRINLTCEISEPVMLHKESFTEAMNNLIKNAKDHAFRDNRPEPELTFRIFEENQQIIIDYTNNGLRFPSEMSRDDFLTFGKKRSDSPGDGLGGAWIGRVIEAHNGNFEIIYDQNPLHFRISIPKE